MTKGGATQYKMRIVLCSATCRGTLLEARKNDKMNTHEITYVNNEHFRC